MSLLDNLPHTVDLSRVTYIQDEFGADVPSDAVYAADEPAWVQKASATLIKEFAAKSMVVTHSIYMTRDPGLRFNDTITIKNGYYAGKKVVFRGFGEDSVGADILFLAMAEIYRQTPAA